LLAALPDWHEIGLMHGEIGYAAFRHGNTEGPPDTVQRSKHKGAKFWQIRDRKAYSQLTTRDENKKGPFIDET